VGSHNGSFLCLSACVVFLSLFFSIVVYFSMTHYSHDFRFVLLIWEVFISDFVSFWHFILFVGCMI